MPIDREPAESPELSGGTAVLERTQTSGEDGDHERFAHYVRKDRIVESAVMGSAVVALCGKVWVPGRDPSKFPVCPDCLKIYQSMRGGSDDES